MDNARPRIRGRFALGFSEDLAEIMRTVLGTLSQNQLEIRSGGEVSGPTFGRMRNGKVPTPHTIEKVALLFHAEFCRHYGEEITAAEGSSDPEAVTRWLLAKSNQATTPASTETDAAEKIRQFAGAEDLPPEDINAIGAIVQAFISERRRQQGRE